MKGWWVPVLAVIAGLTVGHTLRGTGGANGDLEPITGGGAFPAAMPGTGPESGRVVPHHASLPALANLQGRARWLAETALATGGATPEELAGIWAEVLNVEAAVDLSPGRYRLKEFVMMRWVELAPREAVVATRGTWDESLAWECWAKVDFGTVMREGMAAGSAHVESVLEAKAKADPERLDKAIEGLPRGEDRQQLLVEKTRLLAQRDVEAGLALAEEAASRYERKWLLGVVGAEIAEEDPDRSMQLFEEVLKDWERSGNVPVHSSWVYRMTRHDPERTMTAAIGSGSERVVFDATRVWVGGDEDGYAAWLRARPDVAERDEHLECVVHITKEWSGAYGDKRFEKALGWAEELSTEEKRAQHRTTVIADWVAKDRAGAAAYLGTEQPTAGERAVYEAVIEEEQQ